MQNLSQNEFNQIAIMRGLSRDELEQIAKIRKIKNYEDMKKEDLIISLLKSKKAWLSSLMIIITVKKVI